MHQYFATVARGLETIAAQELEQLGAHQVHPTFTGVEFQGDRALLYRVNLWARLPFRILQVLHTCPSRTAQDLYDGVQSIDWSAYLQPHQTLAVNATGKNRQLNHTHFTALQVKNAIVDQQRDRSGQRSSVNPQNPDVQINVHIEDDQAVISLDSSGTSLHRRGYRPAMSAAPLKETLAAALIAMSDWQPEQPFLDPLCGSGTLPLEASLKALNIAPGLFRSQFGFQTWLDYDAELWQNLVQDAKHCQRSQLPAPIWGSDQDSEVIHQARINAHRCGVAEQVKFRVCDLADLEAPAEQGVILCNPPYGERLGEADELEDFYRLMGDVLKQRFKGWTAFVLSGNKALAQHIGLKSAARMSVYNGAIACKLLKYELY